MSRPTVTMNHSIFFGVRCHRDDRDERNKLDQELEAVPGVRLKSTDWWPYRWTPRGDLNLKNPTRENLKLLSDEEDRQEYAQNIAEDLGRVWNAIKDSWG